MLDQLIEELGNINIEIRAQAREQLLQIGAPAVDALIAALQSKNHRLSWQAAVVLRDIPDPRWKEPMRAALNSPNILLAQAAVAALEGAFGSQIIDYFLEVLPHSRLVVQMALLNALERMGDARAVGPLSRFLEKTDISELRYSIIQVLGKLGDPSVVPLIRSYQDDPNHHVRERAAIALDRLTSQSNHSVSS
jgi:HEAT repeat protein